LEKRAEKNTHRGLRRAPALNARLAHNRLFRSGALLRRYGPVPGILAARRPGAIMDKSGRPRITTSKLLKTAEYQFNKDRKKRNLKTLKCYLCIDPKVLPMSRPRDQYGRLYRVKYRS
jgi:hypothetical protein